MKRRSSKQGRSYDRSVTHRRWRWFLGLTVAGGVVWALVQVRAPSAPRVAEMVHVPVTGSLVFPARVGAARPELRALYEFAARRPDVMHFVPCFCGCGWAHRSAYDCFIDEVRADGTVLIDDMSFT